MFLKFMFFFKLPTFLFFSSKEPKCSIGWKHICWQGQYYGLVNSAWPLVLGCHLLGTPSRPPFPLCLGPANHVMVMRLSIGQGRLKLEGLTNSVSEVPLSARQEAPSFSQAFGFVVSEDIIFTPSKSKIQVMCWSLSFVWSNHTFWTSDQDMGSMGSKE